MQLPYSAELDIPHLCRIFDNKSECYKLFWFQALVTKISEGMERFSFDELIDEMIADAWYMVTEYHLNLGPSDNLEKVVRYICRVTMMKPSEKKEEILNYLKNCEDKEVLSLKRALSGNVPYRLQAPFLADLKGRAWECGKEKLISRINASNQLGLYYFERYCGLHTVIFMKHDWLVYIRENQEIVKGWIRYHMAEYLQRRNPSVPGILDKLSPPRERNLERVKKYWKMIRALHPIYEIYGQKKLPSNDISIDHFVPWSYVAHDELWNLHPTIKSINSRKSNRLPDWEKYFPLLCEQEYLAYTMLWQYEKVRKEFEFCAEKHLNNTQIRRHLYREGLSRQEFCDRLSEVVKPVYQAAQNSGFDRWIYQDIV